MAYSNLWDETYPPSSLPANQIHTAIHYWAIAIRERLNDVFGTSDWATAVQPFQPAQINFRGATPAIRGGSASLRFRNNADTFDNITLADAGDLTARRNLISTNNLVSNNDLVFNAANARILPGSATIRFRNFADTFDNLLITDVGDVTIRGNIGAVSLSSTFVAVSSYIWAISGSIRFRNLANNVDNLVMDNVGNVSILGTLTPGQFNGKVVSRPIFDNGLGGAAKTIDWNNGNYQKITLNAANCTITFANPIAGAEYTLWITQDGTGGRLITWPANLQQHNSVAGTTPTGIQTAASQSSMLIMNYTGTIYAELLMNFFPYT